MPKKTTGKTWPNNETWSALRRRKRLRVGDEIFTTLVVPCSKLLCPTGRLVACDPFAAMDISGNPYVKIPPGKYPVKVTLADVSEEQNGSHIREAYASLILSTTPEVERKVLTPSRKGKRKPRLRKGEFVGFPVDAGTACFVDEGALFYGMPDPRTWYEGVFENEREDCWFKRMDDPSHIRAGIANIPLPLAKDGANLILFHSGWGDGFYPVIGGYDAIGKLVAIHIDFFVISSEEDFER